MKCPYCGSRDTEVVETRDSEDLETIRRRRECVNARKDLRLTKELKILI
jgi:transcriptional repressor NrdR